MALMATPLHTNGPQITTTDTTDSRDDDPIISPAMDPMTVRVVMEPTIGRITDLTTLMIRTMDQTIAPVVALLIEDINP